MNSVCNMKAILAVAVLAMAAFAGVMIVGDDADAVDVKYTSYVITLDGTEDYGDPDGLGEFNSFSNATLGNKLTFKDGVISGTVAQAPEGQIAAIFGDYDVYDGINHQIVFTIKGIPSGMSVYWLSSLDGSLREYTPIDGTSLFSPAISADAEGFEFVVWATGGLTTVAQYNSVTKEFIGYDLILAKSLKDFDVTFILNGSEILDGITAYDVVKTEDLGDIITIVPVQSNYTFKGWEDTSGKIVIAYSIDKETYTLDKNYEFTDNVTLTAKFIPNNMTVTFKVGDTITTQTVLYNEAAMKPELPAGYVSWCIVTVAEDGTETWAEFNFNNKIIEDITLVAKAKEIIPVYDITFQIEGKVDVIQKSDSMVIPDTTREGYIFQGWVILNGAQYVDPSEYVKTISENTTFVAVYKIASEAAYTVTFEIEGKTPVSQKADSLTLPDTTRAGFDFMGWVVKGSSDYVDPMTYAISGDITFVAVYKAVEVVKYTVTFINGDDFAAVEVIAGELVNAPEAPEGMFWLFDADAPVTADMTVFAKPLTVTVQFAVGEKVYNAYTQTIAYGEKIDTAKLADFIFPAGYDSWNYDFNEPVTADMTVFAKAIPEPEKEPKFYETPLGQCAIVIVVFLVGLLGYGLATGKVSLPKAKLSLKKDKEEKKP